MAKGILVYGAEGSGTRLFTKILLSAGCIGDSDHSQEFDNDIPEAGDDDLVWRRSFPHARRWPNIEWMVESLRDKGYEVNAVVMCRDWKAQIGSQMGHGHIGMERIGYRNAQIVYPAIFTWLSNLNVPYILVTYEGLVMRPKQYAEYILGFFGLELEEDMVDVYDGNKKYYKLG